MELNCDVLVVGCGPAGATAARAAALGGAKVICIEKKREIGNPVQCAEGIGSYLFQNLPFKIPEEQLKWKIDGIHFWVDGKSITRKGELWSGYTIDRREFEQWLAREAVNAGARVSTDTELTELKMKAEWVDKVTVINNGRETTIRPKVIVAADGSESRVLSLLGKYKRTRANVAEVYSWEIHNLKLETPHLEQLYIGDFAPGGYGYIFPKSNTSANVGVGASMHHKSIKEYYEHFIEMPEIKKQINGGTAHVEKTKKAIWGDITDEWIFGNVIAAGDTANHNLKPFIEGILPAVISGNIAGELAQVLSSGKEITHKHYLDQIRKRLHPHFDASNEIYEKCNSLFRTRDKHKHLLFAGLAAQLFELEEIDELRRLTYEALEARFIEESVKAR
ncbi:MAG: NAD(P)/FAD-dependent oxidoreductase [Candidatus Micrarchaeota archaeon]